jgi:type 1 glutamine amidotransferase
VAKVVSSRIVGNTDKDNAMTLRALVVRGGWDGHQPVPCTELFVGFLREHGFEVTVAETLDVYAEPTTMDGLDLVVQCWTSGRLTEDQERGLLDCVRGGAGFAGWHGGVVATFREALGYQYMVGGQFVCHPGGFVDYPVVVTRRDHPIADGVEDFTVHTEQYFCHTDPTVTVLAATKFTGAHGAPETAGAVVPVVWVKPYGQGCVFVNTIGHTPDDLLVPPVRKLTERGLLWAARHAV